MTRGRFAPSPTGDVHLGLARTALTAWLAARSRGGALIMRMEDLDAPRVVPGAAERQLDDLRWLGLDWDEGPDIGGPCGPYHQSERLQDYERAIEKLVAQDRLYKCTCSRKEVALASAPHGPEEYGPVYPGSCRNGPRRPERQASLRFRAPENLPAFEDRLVGRVNEHGARGDFVVRRADGLFSYQLAVVVDDIAMGVDQVVRGDDLLGCTGWQLALYRALGAAPPVYYHIPLVLDASGARLAKRRQGTSLAELRHRGLASERVVGFLAGSLGLVPAGSTLSTRELLAEFSWDRIVREPIRVSAQDLG